MAETLQILTVDEMRAADAAAIGAGVSGEMLMERAGSAVADAVVARWSPRSVLVLCGPGNNGGDGYVAARKLAEAGWPVTVAVLGDRAALKGDAAWASGLWTGPAGPLAGADVSGVGIIVDALFGAGLARPLSGPAEAVLRRAG